MRVIINLFNVIHSTEVSPFSLFINSLVHSLAERNPDNEYIVLNSSSKMVNHYLPNVKSHLIEPPKRNSLTAYRYQRFVLPALVREMAADLLIDANGICFRTRRVPQIVLLDERQSYKSKRLIDKMTFPVSLKYAGKVVSFTKSTVRGWTKKFPEYTDKSFQLHYAASNHFYVHDTEEMLKVRDGYTDTRPYFTWFCDETNASLWEEILKAFSLFKKWQLSNMKLVIICYSGLHNIQQKIKNYKHKDDVVIVDNPVELISSKLIAASYAMLYPAKLTNIALPVLQAIRCNTPVIVCKSMAIAVNNEEAFYWTEEPEHQSLSKQMILCYKNEEFRKEIINAANIIGNKYSYEKLLNDFELLTKGLLLN